MNLLAIDPGKNTGWAWFFEGKLIAAGLGDPRDLQFEKEVTFTTVIEVPRWYPRKREIDTNDLLDLAVLAGRYAGYYEDHSVVELVFPRSWKGALDWKICCERVLEALSPEEVVVLPRRPRKKDVQHDVLDATGIGLWKLGRL